jgi:MFS family permease
MVCNNSTYFQALVGIAFSVGFIVGPVIGAMFARWSHGQSGDWFVVPALFALCLALTDVAFVLVCFKETLPKVCLDMTIINCNKKLYNCIFAEKFPL